MTALLAWSLTLARPIWMLVLLALPVFIFFTWRASRGRPRAADWSALTLRGILLLAIALALAAPRMEFDAVTRSVAFVLDASDSIPPVERQRMQDYIALSAQRRGEDDDVAFLVFADGAAVEAPFSRISADERVDSVAVDPTVITSVIARGESDLDGALRLARASFPPGGARRVVLITDGNQTRGDALAQVSSLLADGVDVQIIPVRYERDREVYVSKLVVPSTANKGQKVPARAVVVSTHDGVPARVRFIVNDIEVASQDTTLTAGRNVFELPVGFNEGANHKVEVRVDPASGTDGNPENNRGLAMTSVRGDPTVLVVSNDARSPLAAALADALEARVLTTGPEGVPTDPSELVAYDGIVLENVAAWLLTDAQKRFLRFAVEELGVGLVCVGGTETYGPGGYAGTEIEDILPISSEVKQKRVLPSGALVVILHTCEFPGGNEMGRQVTKLSLRALSARDEFGVLQYSGFAGDEWVIPLQQVGTKQRLYSKIDGAAPSDMPNFGPTMKMAGVSLATSTASTKHMLIISDGDASAPSDKTIQILLDQKVTISTVEIDSHGGTGILQKLATDTKGRFYKLTSSQKDKLPQIFIKEAVTVRRSAWKEEPFRVAIGGIHDMIRGFGEDDFPALLGYTITTAKPGSDVILSGPEGDPILATWRHGLGEVTAWTSDASKRWARPWMGWGGYGRFWAQVVRSTLRALQRPGLRVETDVDGGTANVVLDALGPGGDYLNGLSVRGKFVDPEGETGSYDVVQTGPGRYQGSFPATKVGTYLATLTYQEPDDPETTSQVHANASVAYSAEHLAQASNERFFARAETQGATLLDLDALTAAEVNDPSAPAAALVPWLGEAKSSSEPLDLWPWIAALAAFLLVLDVAVRRVRWKLPTFAFLKFAFLRRRKKQDKPAGKLASGVAKAPTGAFRPAALEPPRAGDKPQSKAGPKIKIEPDDSKTAQGLLGAKRRAKKRQDWETND